jgi:hypothetical protein
VSAARTCLLALAHTVLEEHEASELTEREVVSMDFSTRTCKGLTQSAIVELAHTARKKGGKKGGRGVAKLDRYLEAIAALVAEGFTVETAKAELKAQTGIDRHPFLVHLDR